MSNLFLLKFMKKLDVFVYPVEIDPEPQETFARNEVMRIIHRQIKTVFGAYALAGKCIASTSDISEEPTFKAAYKDTPYEVTIRSSRRSFFAENTSYESRNEEHLLIDNVINFIIK